MGQETEKLSGAGDGAYLPPFLRSVMRRFGGQRTQAKPSMGQLPAPSDESPLQISAPLDNDEVLLSPPGSLPLPVPPSRREQRLLEYHLHKPRSDDGQVHTKRRHRKGNKPPESPTHQSRSPIERREIQLARSLMITPRFAKEFDGLSPKEREEIKGGLNVITQGKGQWHPVRDVKRGVKLYTGREHAGKGDNLRIIFTPDKEGLGSYYVLGIIQGHDYSVNTVRSFIESAKHVSSWLLDGKMIGLEAWLKSLT